MAEFCKKHCEEVMGINPFHHPEWVVSDGFRCEECGLKYLEVKNEEKN